MRAPGPVAPRCKFCQRPLRRYRWRVDGRNPIAGTPVDRQWGDYGDNLFCGRACGYEWAVWHWRRLAAP